MRIILIAFFLCAGDRLPTTGAVKGIVAEEHVDFVQSDWDGTLERVRDATIREAADRESPRRSRSSTANLQNHSKRSSKIDAQGRKVRGRERYILVDTLRPLHLGVTVLQGPGGTRDLLRRARRRFAFIERISAAGYWGQKWLRRSSRPAPDLAARSDRIEAHLLAAIGVRAAVSFQFHGVGPQSDLKLRLTFSSTTIYG